MLRCFSAGPASRSGLLLWLALTALTPRAHAYCRLTTDMPLPGLRCTEQGIGLEWRRSCISYSLTARSSPTPDFEAIRDVADLSFAAWLDVTCEGRPLPLELAQTERLAACQEPEYNTRGPNANSILFVHDWAAQELPSEAFGLTLVWHDQDTGEILDADMQLNETLGRLELCGDTCPRGAVDIRNVMTHEAGHFLGLGHSPIRGTTMSARAELGEVEKRSLESDDIEGVCSIYADKPEPSCTPEAFEPDNGWTSECIPDTARTRCGCSVPGAPSPRGPAALVLALSLCVLLRHHPLRRRAPARSAVTARSDQGSSSSPSAKKR